MAHLSQRLLEDNNTVTTIDNLSSGFIDNIPDGVRFIKGDCYDKKSIDKLKNEKFDMIFHIAGQSSGEISFEDPEYDLKTNTLSTLMLLNYSVKTKCRNFIYASTMSVYGDHPNKKISEDDKAIPKSFYAIEKLASEQYLKLYSKYNIKISCLRLFNVYGPGQNMFNLKQGMISIFQAY